MLHDELDVVEYVLAVTFIRSKPTLILVKTREIICIENPGDNAGDHAARIFVAADMINTTPKILESVRQSFFRWWELYNTTLGRHFKILFSYFMSMRTFVEFKINYYFF